MIFTRTHHFKSSLPAEDIKGKLIGKHVKIHNLDFEIFEKEGMLKIIPHAEQVESIKTLPITHIEFKGQGGSTDVVLTSKMRRIDKGGPYLVMMFSSFMIIGALIFYFAGGESYRRFFLPLGIIGVLIFIVLMLRLNSGYYDYVRKVK